MSFQILNDEAKIKRKAEKAKLRKADEAVRLEELRARQDAVDEDVKGKAWADVSDDDEQEQAPVAASVSSDSDDDEDESPIASPVASPKLQHQENGAPGALAKPPPLPLTKKEKAALKQAELDDLDAVLAEFGVVSTEPKDEPQAAEEGAGAGGGKKKKKKDKAPGEAPEEPAPPAPATAAPELDDATKAAALEALKKKAGGGGGKKKAGGDAKSAAAAEAKKRVANAPKQKKDKMAYDR